MISRIIFIIFTVILSLTNSKAQFSNDYGNQFQIWKNTRIENLKSENGWLNLAGLYWLTEGENTFGGDINQDHIFPKEKSPKSIGTFTLKKDSVWIKVNEDVEVFSNNEKIKNQLVFPSNKTPIFSLNSLRWFIIKRGEKYAIRLRDLESQELKDFKGIESFPLDKKWKIEAKFSPHTNKKIEIVDITGQTSLQDSPGKITFKIAGKEYSLDVLEGGKSEYFVIFADQTNKKSTYGAGRFIYIPKENENGLTEIDFNRAINPPCAFTSYATCPLPPAQNKLRVEIKAGEKNYGFH